jgi:hypothetical protein
MLAENGLMRQASLPVLNDLMTGNSCSQQGRLYMTAMVHELVEMDYCGCSLE